MNSESLQTLSTTVMLTGLVFTGLGGYGFYYFGRAASDEKEPAVSPTPLELELQARLVALQKVNDELRERVRVLEREAAERKAAAVAPQPPVQPSPKISPAPVAEEWSGASLLEEIIESSAAAEPKSAAGLGEAQCQRITAMLRKHKGRSIEIHCVSGDSAGFNFAQALKRVFADAEWRVTALEQIPYAKAPAGLFISSSAASAPENAIIPHDALTAAGFQVSRRVDSNLKGEKTVLLVGVAVK